MIEHIQAAHYMEGAPADAYLDRVLEAVVSVQANGDFALSLKLPIDQGKGLAVQDILRVPTPRGPQPFRIYAIEKTLVHLTAKARHIFYDVANNFLLDCRPTADNGESACTALMKGRIFPSSIRLRSNIPTIASATYIRKSELQALLGEDNSFLNRWGGYLLRDGHEAYFRKDLRDRGFLVELGRNLTGVEATEDLSQIVTTVYPTFVLEDNEVYSLPEKYIRSPLEGQYATPVVREMRIELSEEQKKKPPAELYDYVRGEVAEAFREGLDRPRLRYRVQFLLLGKTEAYKGLKLLEQLDLFDLVTCRVPHLGINVQLPMTAYQYDAIREQFIAMDLGAEKPSGAETARRMVRSLEQQMIREDSPVMEKVNEAQKKLEAQITGAKGGYFRIRQDAQGEPYETLWMDHKDLKQARHLIRINKEGIAVSKNGYNGPYEVAFTAQDGLYANFIHGLRITASMIEAGSIDARHIKSGAITASTITSGRIQSKDGKSYFDLNSGDIVAARGQFTGTVTGSNITNSQLSAGTEYGMNASIQGNGQLKSRMMIAEQGLFIHCFILGGAHIGPQPRLSGSGFVPGAGGVSVTQNGFRLSLAGGKTAILENDPQGGAWLGIYRGSPDYSSNILWCVGNDGRVSTGSDRKLKQDVVRADPAHAIDFMKALSLWDFKWRDSQEADLGCLAQLVEKMNHPYAEGIVGVEKGTKVVSYERLYRIALLAVKGLIERVEKLEQKE